MPCGPVALHAAAPAGTVDYPEVHGGNEEGRYTTTITASQPNLTWGMIVLHILMVTLLSNIGKMYPFFCYRKEAHWRHRLAVAIGMWPRGEVGAGILVLSLSYGIGGPVVTVAMLSLALNLALIPQGRFDEAIAIARDLRQSGPSEQRRSLEGIPAVG